MPSIPTLLLLEFASLLPQTLGAAGTDLPWACRAPLVPCLYIALSLVYLIALIAPRGHNQGGQPAKSVLPTTNPSGSVEVGSETSP